MTRIDDRAARPPVPDDVAGLVVDALFADLRDRRFLKWLFSEQPTVIARFDDASVLASLDTSVQQEIRDAWKSLITEALATASTGEREDGVDYFGGLVKKARHAADKASRKFPQPNYVALKIAEEAGEVVRGGVHYAEGRMEWSEVEGEIVQLLAMLIRFVTEGDQVNGIVPPDFTALASPPVEAGKVEAEPVERLEVVGPTTARKHPRGNYVRYTDHAATVAKLTKERDELRALVDRLRTEAQCHAMEARTANATVYECYQAATEGKGEPGNWHGAAPVKEEFARLRTRLSALEKDRARVVEALREARRGMEMVHDGLADPTRPRQSVGEVAHHWLATIDAALGEMGE